jgi:hypothetical protein
MNREDLLSALKTVAPALAKTNVVEDLECFWFGVENVSAFNDVLGVEVSLPTIGTGDGASFVGGVRGETLLRFLQNASKDEIKISKDEGGGASKFSARRSRFATPLAVGDRPFDFPPIDDGTAVTPTEEFLDLIERSALTMGEVGAVQGWQAGVTLDLDDGGVATLYSTNSRTAFRGRAKVEGGGACIATVLPPRFIDFLVRCRGGGDLALVLHSDWVQVIGENFRAFSRTTTLAESRNYPDRPRRGDIARAHRRSRARHALRR